MSESGSPLSSASGNSVATAAEVTNSPTVCLDARKVRMYTHVSVGCPSVLVWGYPSLHALCLHYLHTSTAEDAFGVGE